jgi:hypothetical protein
MKSQFMDVKQAADLANKNSELRSKTIPDCRRGEQFNPGTGKYDQNIGKLPKTVAPGVNVTVAGGAAGDFSDAALDQAAELYATSGQMPSLGMGKASSALRVKIANRAAELHPLNNLAGIKPDSQPTKPHSRLCRSRSIRLQRLRTRPARTSTSSLRLPRKFLIPEFRG